MLLGRLAPLPAETPRDAGTPEPTGARSAEPHRQLMAAVLQAVVDDYQGGSDRRRRAGCRPIASSTVRKAVAYVQSTDRAWPFSFENICEALDLDAAEFRVKLARLRQGRVARAGAGAMRFLEPERPRRDYAERPSLALCTIPRRPRHTDPSQAGESPPIGPQ